MREKNKFKNYFDTVLNKMNFNLNLKFKKCTYLWYTLQSLGKDEHLKMFTSG